MSEINKKAEEIVKLFNDTVDKGVKIVNESTKDLTDSLKRERKKMEIRSQIGEHQRALTKAYTRLGEAYYASKTAGKAMENMEDVEGLIKSNKKVVELLTEQLEALEKQSEGAE